MTPEIIPRVPSPRRLPRRDHGITALDDIRRNRRLGSSLRETDGGPGGRDFRGVAAPKNGVN